MKYNEIVKVVSSSNKGDIAEGIIKWIGIRKEASILRSDSYWIEFTCPIPRRPGGLSNYIMFLDEIKPATEKEKLLYYIYGSKALVNDE